MYDKNRDGIITMNEMEYRYARRRMENAQQNPPRPSSGRRDEKKDEEDKVFGYQWGDRKSYRRKPLLERMPEGLPDWFTRDDADLDGQVSMPEFSTAWTDSVMEEFNRFDLNQDGLITPRECLKAVETGAIRGDSYSSSSDDASDDSDSSESDSGSSTESRGSESSESSGSLKIDPKYYEYFRKVVQKYDTSNDGVLTANEWASMSKDPSAADTNGDGRISVEEYARWSMK
jgi:Ca2+-binding EF-hand superfamily protein